MKAHLLGPDSDLDVTRGDPPGSADLVADLDLLTLWACMAQGDPLIRQVVQTVMLHSLTDPEEISYRQHVLKDCLAHPEAVRALYEVAGEGITAEKSVFLGFLRARPEQAVSRSVKVIGLWLDTLRRLREAAEQQAGQFTSSGFTNLFEGFIKELSEEYLATVQDHLRRLEFRNGLLLSARLGRGNEGVDYVLRLAKEEHRSLFNRVPLTKPTYTHTIPERDQGGFSALSDIRDAGLGEVANAVAQSVDHIRSFLQALRSELAFYLGCVNLHTVLRELGQSVCLPHPADTDARTLAAQGLFEVCLAIRTGKAPVANDLSASGKSLLLITGPNQGGKSTFLRSIGLAQLMMQAGLFAPAREYTSSVASGIFTHFKREEDDSMISGKFDEELARMSDIADVIRPGGVLLSNESFASTNELEGSQIALHVVNALRDCKVRVYFVTHLYDLGHRLWQGQNSDALFLRAERDQTGERTFHVVEGEPLPTSFGQDIYRKVFGDAGPDVTTPAASRSYTPTDDPSMRLDPGVASTSAMGPATEPTPDGAAAEWIDSR